MDVGDYVQLVHRIPRWPRKTRGVVESINTAEDSGGYRQYVVRTADGKRFYALDDDLVRLLRRREIG